MIRKVIILVLILISVVIAAVWYSSLNSMLRIAGIDIIHGRIRVISSAYNDYTVASDSSDPYQLKQLIVREYNLPGFRYIDERVAGGFYTINAYLSLFPFIMLSATYPIIAFIRGPLRRYRRRRKGLCVKCGYNLTGNTTGICSECGTTTTSGVEI